MADTLSHILLFNDKRYQRCNLGVGQRLFRYDHLAGDRLVGTLSGVVEDGVLDCGHSAPFGGVDWVRRREPVGSIVGLIRAAAARARDGHIHTIRVRARPAYFGANETAAEFALVGLGATIESCEISLGIEVWRYRTPDEYIAALRSFGRNRLRHGLCAGTVICPAESAGDWAACYELLAKTKQRRGVQLKISLDYLMRLHALFGERICMHRLLIDGALAAAALVYRVAPGWDCLIAWGDDLAHRDSKVMNVMTYYLVRAAIVRRVAVVDLGISSVVGAPDDGLIQFKRSVGGTTGLRINFRLPLGGLGATAS